MAAAVVQFPMCYQAGQSVFWWIYIIGLQWAVVDPQVVDKTFIEVIGQGGSVGCDVKVAVSGAGVAVPGAGISCYAIEVGGHVIAGADDCYMVPVSGDIGELDAGKPAFGWVVDYDVSGGGVIKLQGPVVG